MVIEIQGKLEKSQGKVKEKSGNSVSKFWQTPGWRLLRSYYANPDNLNRYSIVTNYTFSLHIKLTMSLHLESTVLNRCITYTVQWILIILVSCYSEKDILDPLSQRAGTYKFGSVIVTW